MWSGSDGHDLEIFLDGSQLTDNDYDDGAPNIHNGQVVWYGYDGHDYEIFHNGSQFTDNDYSDFFPQIHNGQVVWYGYDGHDYEIFHNGSQLTDNDYHDQNPEIHNGQVVWFSYAGPAGEIFLDGIQITDNGRYPHIHNGQVVWFGSDGHDGEIYLYNGTRTIQLTDNDYHDTDAHIHNGQVTWIGSNGSDYEIFLDGIRLTDNDYKDWNPQIHNGQVVWSGWDGNDYEIFLATLKEDVSKLPLGGSESIIDASDSQFYKIYVPTRWGGTLTVTTDNGWVELYYPDTETKITDVNNEISYAVPEGNHGWYYVKHYGTGSYTILNTFVQEGEVLPERKPWNISTWVPFSDVLDDGSSLSEIENLYDPFGPLQKYDEAVSGGLLSPATDWEMGKSVLDMNLTLGHYIYNGNARETFAEKDWKFDWDVDYIIEDPGPYDFYNSLTNQLGKGLGDGDLNDTYNATWWGHCNGWAVAAIIFKDPATLTLQGNFTVDDVKGLLTEVGMRPLNKKSGFIDIRNTSKKYTEESWTKDFHDFLREWVKKEQKAVFGNLKAISREKGEIDQVWNHPIWYYAAEMKERVDGNEKIVDVTLTLKSADDLGYSFREDSNRSAVEKVAEGAYGAGAWQYHLAYDDNGEVVITGSGWDTTASDDQNTKYIIPYLVHPMSGDEVFEQKSGSANPEVRLYANLS